MQETLAALLDQLVYIDNFLSNSDTPNLDVDGQLSIDLAAFVDDAFIFADEEKPDKPFLDDDDHNNTPPIDPEEGHSWLQNDVLGSSSSERGHLRKGNEGPGGLHSAEDEMNDAFDSSTSIGAFGGFNKAPNPSENTENWKEQSRNPQNHFSAYKQGDKTKNAKLGRKTTFETAGHDPVTPSKAEDNASLNRSIPDLSNVPKFPVPPGAEMSLKQAGLSLNQIDLLSALIAQHQTSMQNATNSFGQQQEGSSLASNLRARANANFSTLNPVPNPLYHSKSATAITNAPIDHCSLKTESPGSINGSEYSSSTVSGQLTPTMGGPSAELDKRRRSLAASARFRIKKKLKEKELEEQINQLNDMVRNFEIKIDELELENRLLKNLIIEKGNQNSDEELKLLKERAKFSNKK